MKRPFAYITAPWTGTQYQDNEYALHYCRQVYDAGFTPICPLLFLSPILNDKIPQEHKDGLDMGRDFLRRSHVLVVCGDTLPVQYRAFAARKYDHTTSEQYWLSVFSDELPALELNTDFHRPAKQNFRGAAVYETIPAALHEKICAECRKLGITPYAFYMGAFHILLSKFGGGEDIVVGFPASGRGGKFLDALGMFVNTLALRGKPEEKTVRDFLNEIRAASVDALTHQDYPYGALVKKLDLRPEGRNPLFDVMLAYQSEKMTEIIFGDEPAELLPVPVTSSKYDFTFNILPRQEDVVLMVEYCTALFKESNQIGSRIQVFCGDLQKDSMGLESKEYKMLLDEVGTVINAAASVKHYGSYQYFREVNVDTVGRLIAFCRSGYAKLIHISTLSVSGNSFGDDFSGYISETEKHFYESNLYIGQPLENVYARSKFEAEKLVLEAALNGLPVHIMRMGNLTNRQRDGVFQINHQTNAAAQRIKGILELGVVPDYLINEDMYVEFTPIDEAAQAIMLLVRHFDPDRTVFHINSTKVVYLEKLMGYFTALGYPLQEIPGDEFTAVLRETAKQAGKEHIFETFINDMDEQDQLNYDSNIRIKVSA